MVKLTESQRLVVATCASCFRVEVFETFCSVLAAWIVCVGRHTISRVWETTGRWQTHDCSPTFRLFSEAVWKWDEVCRMLLLEVLKYLVTGKTLWIVIDDTLCHKRGGHVAFGGVFLDPVLSSSKYKLFRFGNNWVTLGVVVRLPFRQDRYFCLNVLWRIFEKQGDKPSSLHRTKSQLAAEMVKTIARWLPDYQLRVVGDIAYVNRHLLKDRVSNVELIGPIRWDAALTKTPGKAARRCRNPEDRLPTPREILDGDDPRWPLQRIHLRTPGKDKELTVKVVRNVYWHQNAGPQPLMLILVRDPTGDWRDEALLCTDTTLTVEEALGGYCRRWSVEVAYADSKQSLGFHDPEVWCEKSVQRAHPMAWYVGSFVILWYALFGKDEKTPERFLHDPKKNPVTFNDMLCTCRHQIWQQQLAGCTSTAELAKRQEWLTNYLATAL